MARESALARLPLPAKLGIIVTVLALCAVAYWVVFYTEISQQITTAQAQQEKLRDDLATAKKGVVAYQKDLAELHDREQRKGEIEKVLPSQAQYPSFLSSVQTVANASGVNLTAWAPELEANEEFYARVPMKVKLTGRFHQVAKFFFNVAELDRIINMENISLTNPKVEGDEVLVQVEVQATAFRTLAEPAADTGAPRRRPGAGGPK